MAVANDLASLVEAVCKPNPNINDHRTLLTAIIDQLTALNQSTGVSPITPTSGSQKAAGTPPPPATAAAAGANGTITLNIQNPSLPANATVYHEVSYSTVKNFSQNVTTLPKTAQTSVVIPNPGQSLFIRYRSSFDGQHWNSHQLVQQSAVESGLQSSAATSNAIPLNQTNYATVVAQGSVGGAPTIQVHGVGGPYNGYTRVKGLQQFSRPSATIINASYQSTAFVAFDGKKYQVANSLPGTFPDSWEPVGVADVNGTPGGGGPTGNNGGRLTAVAA